MTNTYLISYEEKAGGTRKIGNDVILGPGAVGCTFVLDSKSVYWKRSEKALQATTREEAIIEYNTWKEANKNAMKDTFQFIRKPQLIEQLVIAE